MARKVFAEVWILLPQSFLGSFLQLPSTGDDVTNFHSSLTLLGGVVVRMKEAQVKVLNSHLDDKQHKTMKRKTVHCIHEKFFLFLLSCMFQF